MGNESRGLSAGDKGPAFCLPGVWRADGGVEIGDRTLEELLGDGGLLLSFLRGTW